MECLVRIRGTDADGAPAFLVVASGERVSEVYGHDQPSVCRGDGQTEAGLPSQIGLGDALFRRMLPYLGVEHLWLKSGCVIDGSFQGKQIIGTACIHSDLYLMETDTNSVSRQHSGRFLVFIGYNHRIVPRTRRLQTSRGRLPIDDRNVITIMMVL